MMGAVHRSAGEVPVEWTPAATLWEKADVGDAVRLQKTGWPPHDGYVEDKTQNGDIVWVVSVGERRLFHRADGYSLLVWK